MKWYQSPRFLCFAGGVAAALVGALRQMGLDREQAAALVLQLWDRQEESP